ncbi:MAG: phosphate ABC transporter substrate-binding protein PstS family protein [Chloroflexi bacterium AL-W]|nr:phosphate ABC transporter substrate-binding protein PstS family protein [Chloroflexi bacterium AL-N1]NOK67194.1 phosphate ABC transporter substrate-binding protein PstS family protein [Chloroflexi bacterium AL-N10]NOK75312.1 phosphate ABC transporter substrate-binding protein PstS family protein [Chloroflexi bacterium AL-N5]NOK82100.1 phosphate ABC transporter substrate-binding protein PstS family protein [Chloroflexi bacterium AL-W]NOK89945.1 phosphate ABC transporter substrate-binding prot
MNTSMWGIGLASLVISCVLVACGARAETVTPFADPATVAGSISITGSSTVFPLTAAVVEAFADEGSSADITVAVTGTGAGIERFCQQGDVDIVNASRPMTDEEQAVCRTNGRLATGFLVGTDALAVVVSADNTFVEALSLSQLARIFSGDAITWDAVDPAYPPEPIALFSPGTDSGTFDYFVEKVFIGDSTALQQAPGIVLSENDNVLVDGIATDPTAIGYFGFAYYRANQEQLRAVALETSTAATDPVLPTAASVDDGSYVFARPLYIYTSTAILAEKPHVAAFIHYYLTNVTDFIDDVGYFPLEVTVSEQTRENFRHMVESTRE